jgi:DNA-binding CsgD family transcriptional regulator
MSTRADTQGEGLLERESELFEIDLAVEKSAAGDGRVLLIEGEPGIGKTALLDAVAERARTADMTVLAARAGELEREFGFGAVRQLFESPARKLSEAEIFAGQARFAAPVLDVEIEGIAHGASAGESVYPAVHGLYWMTVNLAESAGALALILDDAHWADGASLRFLAYLARRLEELPLLLAVAARPGKEADLLHHSLAGARPLTPQRLSEEATATVVRSVAPHAGDEDCRSCHEATGGNAFYVHELAAAIRDREGHDGAAQPDAWSPENVTRTVAGRIAALAPDAREVAHACAILGDGAAPHTIATLAGLTGDAARAGIDSLRAGGILAPSSRIEFIHPIVRAAVQARIPPGLRSSAHSNAARLEAAGGGGAERVAIHLLETDPAEDPWTCERLIDASRVALSRGAPEAAASYLERALSEPPPPEDRPRLLLELGTATAFALRPGATGYVRQGFELARSADERLEAALLQAHLSFQAGRGAEALEPLTRVLAESPPDSSRALFIEGFAANVTRAQLSARRAAQPIIDRLRERTDVGDEADPPVLIAIAAEYAMAGTDRPRAVAMANAGLAGLDTVPPLARAFAGLTATRTLIVADEHERTREVLEGAIEAARERGALFDFIYYAVARANLAFRAGAIFDSEADARGAYDLARGERWPLALASIASYLVQALVERGELEEAWGVLRETGLDGPPAELADVYTSNALLYARAGLRLADGDPAAALRDLEELRARQEAFMEPNPSVSPWRSATALTYAALGNRDAARPLAAEEIDLARRWGAPRALGIALRSAGVVEEGAGGIELLREAVEVLANSFARLEHGRALADLGDAALARGDRLEARELLRQALELAHVCGATPLEERVLTSLRATGARPRRAVLRGPEALTPSESRVAGMAADGLSNHEIAACLFIAVRTVEYHLQNSYRKLGIDSRTKLASALEGA